MMSRTTTCQRSLRWMLLLLTAVSFSMVSCSFDNPGMPQWDVDFAIPLNSQWYGLDSLVSRPDELAENGGGIDTLAGGLLRFFYEEPIDSVILADSLTNYEVEDTTRESTELGAVDIDSLQDAHGAMAMDAFIPNYSGSGYYSLPSLAITANTSIQIDSLRQFREAHIIEGGGYVDLTLTNDTDLQWDSISVEFACDEPGYPSLGAVEYRNIGPGESQTQTIDLSGKTLKQNLILFASGRGPQQGNVFIAEDDGISFTAEFSPLIASYYRGVIVKQDPEHDTTLVDFEEDNWVTEALANSVTMRFRIENYTQTEDSVYVTLPAITDYTNTDEALRFGFLLPPPEPGQGCVCLDTLITVYDKYLQMDLPEGYDTPNPGFQAMDVLITAVVLSGGFNDQGDPLIRELSETDTVVTTMTVEHFDFAWMWGSAKEEITDLDETVVEIDVWDDTEDQDLQADLTGNVALEAAQIIIDLRESEFNVPTKLELDITSVNSTLGDGQQEITEHFVRWIDPAEKYAVIGGYGDPDSGRVVRLLNHFPNRLVVEGQALMGRDPLQNNPNGWDPYEPYLLHNTDRIIGKTILEAPLSVSVDSLTTMHAPVMDLSEGIESGLQSANVLAYVTNTVPIGGTMHLLAGSFANEETARRELTLANEAQYRLMDPLTINSPEIDPATGRAVSSLAETVEVGLTDDGLDILAQDHLYVRQVMQIHPTTTTVRAYVQDGIEVALVIEGVYRVNEEE